ncbi:hypothetical protein CRYUN_Cryun26dG0021200 [Craigia yunnanensis]
MTIIFKEMGQFLQLQHVLTLKPYPCKFMPLASFSHPDFNPLPKSFHNSSFFRSSETHCTPQISSSSVSTHHSTSIGMQDERLRNNVSIQIFLDIISELELGKPGDRRKPEKRVDGVFWIILLNLGIYVADHLFQVQGIQSLYLYHNWPAWYQFVTSTFCHANWKHLSSNFFFLYIFGKHFALLLDLRVLGNSLKKRKEISHCGFLTYLQMSWDRRKILEVLILGQFVIEKVMEAAQDSTGLSGSSYSLQSVNQIAHLSGALIGVLLVWLLSKIPSQPPEKRNTKFA